MGMAKYINAIKGRRYREQLFLIDIHGVLIVDAVCSVIILLYN